jgi:hypothetical protein
VHIVFPIQVIVTAVVLNYQVPVRSFVSTDLSLTPNVVQATDGCLVKRQAHHRGQVERPAALRGGTAWPVDWREVTRPIFPATPTDSMFASTLGVRPPSGDASSAFPREWAAFVVDTSGHIVPCSFGNHDGLAADAPLALQFALLRFAPAEVAGRRVPQLVVLERRR